MTTDTTRGEGRTPNPEALAAYNKIYTGIGAGYDMFERGYLAANAQHAAAAVELLREAVRGLNSWTLGCAPESEVIVCGCCEKRHCAPNCDCKQLIDRIEAHLSPTPPTTGEKKL